MNAGVTHSRHLARALVGCDFAGEFIDERVAELGLIEWANGDWHKINASALKSKFAGRASKDGFIAMGAPSGDFKIFERKKIFSAPF
jgi:hypothetical protein